MKSLGRTVNPHFQTFFDGVEPRSFQFDFKLSPRNLKEAEKYALEALVLEAHQQDAQVPYFLATVVYKPQKYWGKVIEMFDEAMKRDPEAMLSQPYQYEGRIITKMQEQITIYYISELWYILYNQAVKDYDENSTDVEIIELLELAMHVNPNNINTYVLLSKTYDSNEQPDLSKDIINKALKVDSITLSEKANLCVLWFGQIIHLLLFVNIFKYNFNNEYL